jgi:hypothetical protein
MTNILDGIQYRTLNPALPSWNKKIYTNWMDAKELTVFPSGTQFRVKPIVNYLVESRTDPEVQTTTELRTASKDAAMKKIAQLVEGGKVVRLEKYEVPTLSIASLLTDRQVQYKLAGQDKWTHPNYFSVGAMGITSRIEFRIRPDLYWEVTTSNAESNSTLTFDDVESLHVYVDRQLRTSDFDISIKKVRYAG